MLSLPVALLVYQIIALVATSAMVGLVIFKANLDFRLMYLQHPIHRLKSLNLFRESILNKGVVLFSSLVALILTFLPTILTIPNDLFGYEIYYTDIHTIGQEEAQGGVVPALIPENEQYPIFDSFLYCNDPDEPKSTSIDTYQVLDIYLYCNLKKQVDLNPSGVWYNGLSDFDEKSSPSGSKGRTRDRFPEINLQKADATTGVYSPQETKRTTYIFGLQNQDSSTLRQCASNDSALISNFTEFEGHHIQAIRGALSSSQICFPQSDSSVPIMALPFNQKLQASVLDSNDRVFRPSQLSQNKYRIAMTLDVSGMNLNSTHISMGVKKTAHITAYNSRINTSIPNELLDCSPEALEKMHILSPISSKFIFNTLNHTRTACALINLSKQNPNMSIWQATRRAIEDNASINSVYTYLSGTPSYPLGGIMVDLTWFSAYTVAAPVALFPEDNKEYLVAHVYNDYPSRYRSLAEDIEEMLISADPYAQAFNQENDTLLADLALTRAALLQGNTYYFTMSQASLRYGVNTNEGWSTLLAVFASLSLILWVLLMRKVDEFSNLRSMIIDTVNINEKVAKEDDQITIVNGMRRPVRKTPMIKDFGKPAKFGFAMGIVQELPILTVDGETVETYLIEEF